MTAAILLAPVCVLIWIAVIRKHLYLTVRFTVPVTAWVTDVQARRSRRSRVYSIVYRAE